MADRDPPYRPVFRGGLKHLFQVRGKDYAQAEASYSDTLGIMEEMLAKLPPDQAEKMRKQLDSIKGKMSAELGAAANAKK